MHAVEGHRADMAEDADARIGTGRQLALCRLGAPPHMHCPMPPRAEHMVADAERRDVAAGLDDFADLLVAEIAHRIEPARRAAFAEAPEAIVPFALHEG